MRVYMIANEREGYAGRPLGRFQAKQVTTFLISFRFRFLSCCDLQGGGIAAHFLLFAGGYREVYVWSLNSGLFLG